jgi:3-deoxy-manno-octulosonate cytidylyltransferase (CMP-KDO synthetase)
MSFSVIIPSRYASSRLPGKPLLDIAGKPMIQHVYEQACQSQADRVIIATDDQRIAEAADSFGAEICMTSAEHESGTDRLQEVVSQLGFADDHVVVNVQGDEPLIPPAVINQVANNLASSEEAGIATLAELIVDIEAVFDPNAVKVTMDKNGRALYFSRAPIPWCRDEWSTSEKTLSDLAQYFRHVGIYAYRVAFLHQFVSWPPSRLEFTEKLEQLRAMENGVAIHVQETCESIPAGVDTQADLDAVRALFQ